MSRIVAPLIGISLFVGTTLFAQQTYRTRTVYVQSQQASWPHTCGDTVYDPDMFALPNGDLQMYAQGANSLTPRDSFFGFTTGSHHGSMVRSHGAKPWESAASYRQDSMLVVVIHLLVRPARSQVPAS